MNLKTVSLTSFAVTTAYTSIYFGQNFLHLNELVKNIQLKKEDDSSVLVPNSVKELMHTVISDMKLKRKEVELVKAIVSDKPDLFHCGFSGHKPGAYLAIPQTFFTQPNQIQITSLGTQLQIPNNSLEIKDLQILLCPSIKEQKFALAHEIYKSRNFAAFYLNGCLPTITFFIFFFIASKFMKSNLQSVQRNPTLFLTHILICAVVSYLGGKFSLTMYSVGKADSQVASLGREYIEGGIEYYERLIKRNKLIRKLNKNAPFTEEGEKKEEWSNLFIVPFAIRINFLKKCLEAVNTNQKNPSLWTHYLTF